MKPTTAISKTSTGVDAAAIATALASNGAQVHLEGVHAPKPKKIKPAAPKITVTEPAKPVNLLDEILQAGDNLAGNKVAAAIDMANTILTDTRALSTFVTAMRTADKLAVQKLSFEKDECEVRQDWFVLDLKQVQDRLQKWAGQGDAPASAILTSLAAFGKSQVDVVGPLWSLYAEMVRPADSCESYADLSRLVKDLQQNGLADRIRFTGFWPKGAIVLGEKPAWSGYLPSSVPMSKAGWQFLLEAETRAKNWADIRQNELSTMKSEADLTPEQFRDGNDGLVFIRVGLSSGALLRARGDSFRVVRAKGIFLQGNRG